MSKKRKIIRWGAALIGFGLLVGGSIFLYMWFMPHRDIQSTPIDITISSTDLIQEYLDDVTKANEKYLQEEGDSKILAVTGTVANISEDQKHQKVILLKEGGAELGVSCTFMESTNKNTENLKNGDVITVKGVIRAGAGYDEDLELYEDAIMEKCDIIK